MHNRTSSRELPLVLFTLALQLSSGLVLAATLCRAENGPAGDIDFKPLALVAFAVAALGLLASVMHLGRPLSAWRSLTNLRHSRLSTEVLLTGLYVASSAGLAWSWDQPQSLWFSAVASVLGVAAVVASAAVYKLPAQPAWNASWVLISFLGTMLTLGAAGSVALLASVTAESFLFSPVLMMLVGATLVITSAAGLRRASRNFRHVAETLPDPHPALYSGEGWLLALHVAFAGILPFVVAAQMTLSSMPSQILAVTSLLIVISGAFIGRALMYSLVKDAF